VTVFLENNTDTWNLKSPNITSVNHTRSNTQSIGWLCGTGVERRSVIGELSLSYARPAADG